jgi:hypothetical protein
MKCSIHTRQTYTTATDSLEDTDFDGSDLDIVLMTPDSPTQRAADEPYIGQSLAAAGWTHQIAPQGKPLGLPLVDRWATYDGFRFKVKSPLPTQKPPVIRKRLTNAWLPYEPGLPDPVWGFKPEVVDTPGVKELFLNGRPARPRRYPTWVWRRKGRDEKGRVIAVRKYESPMIKAVKPRTEEELNAVREGQGEGIVTTLAPLSLPLIHPSAWKMILGSYLPERTRRGFIRYKLRVFGVFARMPGREGGPRRWRGE